MSYYMGDYYAGDYEAGDPFLGFLGLGSLIKRGVSAVARRIRRPTIPAALPPGIAGPIQRAERAVMQHPVLSAAGAAGVGGVLAGAGVRGVLAPGMPAGAMIKGHHMSKRQRIPKHPEPHLVRNRRMRVTNPRALRRAIRRAAGFARMARRVMRFTSPRPPRGRAYFKVRRKRK